MRYCIGDIHGCIKTFQKLIDKIRLIDSKPELYFTGDLVDRGANSKTVIDYIIELKKESIVKNIVRGNHEQMLIDGYTKNHRLKDSTWYKNGAINTIRSFNPKANNHCFIKDIIPESYFLFLNSLPYFIELKDCFIVHAGFNFKLKKPFNDFDAMLWTREEENNIIFTKGKTIIHGHTPVCFKLIKKQKNNSVINIDSGCVYTQKEGLGSLTAINLDKLEFINIKNIED